MNEKVRWPLIIILIISAGFVIMYHPRSTQKESTFEDLEFYGIIVQTIDSCEYVLYTPNNGAGITHKGNCKFCAERKEE